MLTLMLPDRGFGIAGHYQSAEMVGTAEKFEALGGAIKEGR
jgi:hypothetical protein